MINHSAATQESDPTRVTTHRTVLITKLIAAVHHVLCTQLFNSKWRFDECWGGGKRQVWGQLPPLPRPRTATVQSQLHRFIRLRRQHWWIWWSLYKMSNIPNWMPCAVHIWWCAEIDLPTFVITVAPSVVTPTMSCSNDKPFCDNLFWRSWIPFSDGILPDTRTRPRFQNSPSVPWTFIEC